MIKPIKILMVCLGNICRSPLAEGILKSKIKTQGIAVDSAGTAAYHVGCLPDRRSIEVAKKHGIDITNQKARKIKKSDLETFDFIYAMDVSNYNDILAMANGDVQKAKVSMIMSVFEDTKGVSVPDPYYGGTDGFEQVYKMLDGVCDEIIRKINE